MLRFSLVLLLLTAGAGVHAFEFAEFKSGMPRDKVLGALPNWNFDKTIEVSADSILVFDQPEKDTFRRILFNFCNDKLVGVEQDMRPSPKHFITLVNSYTAKHGQPLQVRSNVGMIPTGEKHSLSLVWRKGSDYYGVKYVILPTGEQLSLTFLVYNSCWDPAKY